jgi:hypothetical protein
MSTKIVEYNKAPQILVPEQNKIPGVQYAVSSDGVELPIVNILHSVFALKMTESKLLEIWEEFKKHQAETPAEKLRDFYKQSMVGRGLLSGKGTFLSGMSTYLLKLGPNIGSYANSYDRLLLESPPALSVRFRLQHMARFLASHLTSVLSNNHQPLHFINIAGGTFMDSINACIVTPKSSLIGRKITIHVLDQDTTGPLFGQRALQALTASKAPLENLDISCNHIPYNWNFTDQLEKLLGTIAKSSGIVVASSEGGLFEYGSDEAIVSNLKVLRKFSSYIVGSICRQDQQFTSSMTTVPRDLEKFKALIKRADCVVNKVLETPLSFDLCIQPL